MNYENDLIARYLAVRVLQNEADPTTGLTYEKAITNSRTTKEAVDWWLSELNKTEVGNEF